jgi:hypothetical protein
VRLDLVLAGSCVAACTAVEKERQVHEVSSRCGYSFLVEELKKQGFVRVVANLLSRREILVVCVRKAEK